MAKNKRELASKAGQDDCSRFEYWPKRIRKVEDFVTRNP